MKYHDLTELHYICHIENLSSIMKHGILCHTKVQELKHEDVSMAGVQDRRREKIVPGGMKLHNYVNLYFHGRNPMLRVLTDKKGKNLCVISVDKKVMLEEKAVISDGNAAADFTRFFDSPAGLEHLDFKTVFAKYWVNKADDELTKYKKKIAKCAEVLVPFRVGPENIRAVYVSNDSTKKKIDDEKLKLNVIIDKNLFFGEGEA